MLSPLLQKYCSICFYYGADERPIEKQSSMPEKQRDAGKSRFHQ
jgi:hypothetical protein